MPEPKTIKVSLDANPKGENKDLGGSKYDHWNDRLTTIVASALPVNHENLKAQEEAATAILSGMLDIKPADPVEAIIVGQLIVAHEAALSMYRRGWQQPSEYFEARTKYLSLADKATRTVAVLTERLDQHRGRGQQQITVKHITVNAEQAVVTDSVTTGKIANSEALSPAKLLTTGVEKPMPMLGEPIQREPVAVGGGTEKK